MSGQRHALVLVTCTSKARLDELLEGPPVAELFAAFGLLQHFTPRTSAGALMAEALADKHTTPALPREMPPTRAAGL